MVKLIYSPIASLDGHVEDEQGTFDWAAPDDEVHAFVNELERPIGTYLYAVVCTNDGLLGDGERRRRSARGDPRLRRDLAGRREDCVLANAPDGGQRPDPHERTFDPDAVRRLKETAGADITIGGAELAGQAIARAWSTSYSCSSGRSLLVAASAHCPTTSASRSRDHANRAALRECPDRRAHALRDDRVVRPVDDRSQRPVVVEEDRRTTSPELPR